MRRLLKHDGDQFLTMYSPASWWHPEGRAKMIRRIEDRGFPSLAGWLFFTLSVDPKTVANEREAFEAGKDRLRRMIYALRQAGIRIRRYFFKLELHESGYPHWHLGVDTRSFIDNECVARAWGLGFTKVIRVKNSDWRYLFKYVCKGNGAIPDWALDYPSRIRVFQTSAGFFAARPAATKEPRTEEVLLGPWDRRLRTKFSRWERKALLRKRGSITKVKTIELRCTWREFIIDTATKGLPLIDAYNAPVSNKQIHEIIQWKLPKSSKGLSLTGRPSLPQRFGRDVPRNQINLTLLSAQPC